MKNTLNDRVGLVLDRNNLGTWFHDFDYNFVQARWRDILLDCFEEGWRRYYGTQHFSQMFTDAKLITAYLKAAPADKTMVLLTSLFMYTMYDPTKEWYQWTDDSANLAEEMIGMVVGSEEEDSIADAVSEALRDFIAAPYAMFLDDDFYIRPGSPAENVCNIVTTINWYMWCSNDTSLKFTRIKDEYLAKGLPEESFLRDMHQLVEGFKSKGFVIPLEIPSYGFVNARALSNVNRFMEKNPLKERFATNG